MRDFGAPIRYPRVQADKDRAKIRHHGKCDTIKRSTAPSAKSSGPTLVQGIGRDHDKYSLRLQQGTLLGRDVRKIFVEDRAHRVDVAPRMKVSTSARTRALETGTPNTRSENLTTWRPNIRVNTKAASRQCEQDTDFQKTAANGREPACLP